MLMPEPGALQHNVEGPWQSPLSAVHFRHFCFPKHQQDLLPHWLQLGMGISALQPFLQYV